MTGADIIGALLRAYPPLTSLIPADRIKAGRLPEDAPLDTLLVRITSSVDRQPLKWRGLVRRVDRVSVTVRAASYRGQVAAIDLVRAACAGKVGDIAGGLDASIVTAGRGGDMQGPGNSFEQTQDFRVSFNADVGSS